MSLPNRPPRRWFALLLVVPVALASLAQTRYSVTPIQSASDPTVRIYASQINNHGYVTVTTHPRGAQPQGFIWKNGRTIAVLPALGGTCSLAWGLNDLGHVVGQSCLPGDAIRHAVLWRNGKLMDLDTFGADSGSAALQVNARDDVAGGYYRSDGSSGAFFWRRGATTDLGNLGGAHIYVSGLSASGAVTGWADISNVVDPNIGFAPFHAFLWKHGNLIDLGQIFGSDFANANGMNRASKVVGSSDLVGDQAAHAFLWDEGRIQDLGAQLSDPVSWAIAINNRGQIIGTSGSLDTFPGDGPPVYTMLCPCHTILWDRGQATIIDSQAGPDWTIDLPVSINDAGDIVAYAFPTATPTQPQMVLLKPIRRDDDSSEGSASASLPVANARAASAPAGPTRIHRTSDGKFQIDF